MITTECELRVFVVDGQKWRVLTPVELWVRRRGWFADLRFVQGEWCVPGGQA